METIGAYEAKTHLPRLLDEVSAGKSITITKHGVPVAVLAPVSPVPVTAAEAVEAIRAARKGVRLGRLSIRKMIDEGRRL